MYRIGLPNLQPASDAVAPSFRDSLHQVGYVDGQNLIAEARFADTEVDWLRALSGDLIQRQLDVIVTIGLRRARRPRRQQPHSHRDGGSADPVEHGLVTSLAHLRGNVTELPHGPCPEIAAKNLQLLKEVVPTLGRVRMLWDSSVIHERLALQARQQTLNLGVSASARLCRPQG